MNDNFIKDKWYTTTYQDTLFLGKCVKYENNTLYASEIKIISYAKYNIKTPYRFSSGYTWTLATQEDLDKYLPKDHPDRSDFIPEYVECINKLYGLEVGKIYPCKNDIVIDGKFNNYPLKDPDKNNFFKPSTKAAYDLQNNIDVNTDDIWTPKVGEYAVMVDAGGWGYHPDNNGCIGFITEVGTRTVNNKPTTYIDGDVINPIRKENISFKKIPLYNSAGAVVCRKALAHEIPTEQIKNDTTDNSMKPSKIVLDESHLGRLMSFTWYNNIYDKALFIKENDRYYFLNNCRSNADSHKDKSVYRHSLVYNTLHAFNTVINNIQFLDTQQPTSPQISYKFNIGDTVKIIKGGLGCSDASLECLVTILEKGLYSGRPAYKVSTPKKGFTNSCRNNYDGFCGENSFTLVKKSTTYNSSVGIFMQAPKQPLMPGEIYIPQVRTVEPFVDYTVSAKIADLRLPDYSVQPEKIKAITVEKFNISL